MSSSTKKTYQLALPPESPDNTNKKSNSKGADKKEKAQELKIVTNSKHTSISKKESLESLKQYQSDMKRQKLDNENNENGENVQPEQQTKTASAGGKPKKDEPPKKTPYEILFEQNQRLVQELELSRHKLVIKESQLREFDTENFALREYIVGLENSRDNYQTVYDQLLEEIRVLKNENAEIKANIAKESQQKDLSHIESRAGDLFNQLHIFLLGKPYNNRQSCIMSSTISGSSTINPNASRISFDPRMSLNSSGNQQKKRCSMRFSAGNVNGSREMPGQYVVSGNASEAMECSADRMEIVQEVNGEEVDEETAPQTCEEEIIDEVQEDEEDGEDEVGEGEEMVEEEEDAEGDEMVETEEEEAEEEEIEEEDEDEEETDEEDMEENEEMEHSDVVIGNDQSEYAVPPPQNDALLCTILETTELNESSTSRRSKPDSTYVCDSAGQSFNDQNPNEQNIMVDDTQMLDDSGDEGAERKPAEHSGRRKSVTFSEKLTQEKLIEGNQDKSENQSLGAVDTETTTVMTSISKKIGKQIEQEATVAPPQVIRFEQQPKPILKARASLSNNGNDDAGSDSAPRKSVSCSSRRKNSIVDGNSGGSDRRRSRVSMYSIGGPSDTPLISEELMAQAAAYAAAEAAATKEQESINVDSEVPEMDCYESPVVVEEEPAITEEVPTPTESADTETRPVSLVKRNSSFGIFKSKQKKLESDSEPAAADSSGPEPELNKEIDKNFKDLSEFLFVESPISESKTVSLTKTKGTPKGGNKTTRKVNSTPTSARKKREQSESVISSVKKAVKRKTIDKDDTGSEMEQDPEPQQNQLPPKPMAPKATPSGQRMKKNVSTENLNNQQQSDRPQIPLPPKATPGRKLTKQSSTDNLAEQPVSLEPKATPTQNQRMKKNVSTENLNNAGQSQQDKPQIPLPPKATPGRKLTKTNSVENLAASQENQASLEPKQTPTGGRMRKAVSTENLHDPVSLEPKSTPTSRRLPRNSSAGKLINYNENDEVEEATFLSLTTKATPKRLARNNSASNLPPQQPPATEKSLEPKSTPARQLKKNNSTGSLLVEPKIEPKSTPARRMPRNSSAGNLVPPQDNEASETTQQQQQPKATPARRMAKNNSVGSLASQQSNENQQSIDPKATPVRRMNKTDSAGKLVPPSGASQPPPLPPKAPPKKIMERQNCSENQPPLPPKAPSKQRAPLGTSTSENVPKPPLPVAPAAKKMPVSAKTGGDYTREKILPRKSIGTINENRELNISEEIIEIKDEPVDMSVELSSSSESSHHQEHKENRPDSPIRTEGRRARKTISYKEIPVGSKMRRDGDNIIIKENNSRKSLKVERYS